MRYDWLEQRLVSARVLHAEGCNDRPGSAFLYAVDGDLRPLALTPNVTKADQVRLDAGARRVGDILRGLV